MMQKFVFILFVCALGPSYGFPDDEKKDSAAAAKPDGVGAFAYQDSTGRRYGGTYGLRNGEIIPNSDEPIPSFVTNSYDSYPNNYGGNSNFGGYNNFGDINEFFPEYFRNFENILRDARNRRELWPMWTLWPPIIRPLPFLPPLPPLPPIRPLRILPIPRLRPIFRPLPPIDPFDAIEPLEPLEPLEFPPLWRPSIIPSIHPEEPWLTDVIGKFTYMRTFQQNLKNQQQALDAAMKAYHVTSNQPQITPYGDQGYQNFPGFRPFTPFNFDYNNMMPNFGPNSAFASGYIGPNGIQQAAMINPENPQMPNINIASRVADVPSDSGYNSVHSSSYSRSSNINGQEVTDKGAETIVNNNGKVTKYSVHN